MASPTIEGRDRSPYLVVAGVLENVAAGLYTPQADAAILLASRVQILRWQICLADEHFALSRFVDNGRSLPTDLASSTLSGPDIAAVMVYRYTTSKHFGPKLADQREPDLTQGQVSDRTVGLVLEQLGVLEPIKRRRPRLDERTGLMRRAESIEPGASIDRIRQMFKIPGGQESERVGVRRPGGGEYFYVTRTGLTVGAKNPDLLTGLVFIETSFDFDRSDVGIGLRMKVGEVSHDRPDQVAAYKTLIGER